ncbi:glycosyltransferase family 2 protein [Acinetobacter sp. ANC 4633]|uniref:glycosyltransferase family 2 protein n=1 Tax=Acinetobacter sp. ANC 4633 TaxID=2529845 RepID=UPI00103CB6FF|nr:glycosyltransferase [Acinetobacter sp. ANC 4633]TCB27047.1 glycosyltransferase family 2 protein [Acinetobacter sp. ANC 4633]
MKEIIYAWEFIFFLYFIFVNVSYFFLNILGFFSISKILKSNLHDVWFTKFDVYDIPISIITPAYNEELTIVDSVQSLLNLNYSEFEVLVICDGPKDNTLEVLIKTYDLVPNLEVPRLRLDHKPIKKNYISLKDKRLKVIFKENGGKADALNCGINISSYPLFCAIDADSILDSEALHKLVQPFSLENNTVASGGIIRIANGCEIIDGKVKHIGMPKSWLEKIQVVEYLRAYLNGRMGWVAIDSVMIISGAFGLFSKSAVFDVDGYNHNTVGEDMELVLKLREHALKNNTKINISFVPNAVCWTQCPNNIKILGSQRKRWQKGLLESLWSSKSLLFKPRSGLLGFYAFPFFILVEALGPFIELFGYISLLLFAFLGYINWNSCFYFYFLAFSFGLILSLGAILIEVTFFNHYTSKSIFQLFIACILENLWFRYIHSYWRLIGSIQFLKKSPASWGEMKRVKF